MTQTPPISRLAAWKLAARPKTLPAAVAPVLVGTALAARAGAFRLVPALAALAIALLLQIGVNIANDYFDHVRGIDSPQRKGPVRVTSGGLIPPEQVRAGMLLVFTLAAVIGGYLIAVGGWPVVVIGAAAILSALAYSGGPFPLASHGLGDLFVFLFFGLAAVCGTYYVQALSLSPLVVAAAVPPGLLITNILVVNNVRDIETDRQAGKRTLAVMLGARGSLIEFVALLALAALTLPALWWAGWLGPGAMLAWLSLPLAVPLVRTLRHQHDDGPAMNRALAASARLALIFCVLFAAGILVA